jgi:transcriptional regulator with XRE-family HTH domain
MSKAIPRLVKEYSLRELIQNSSRLQAAFRIKLGREVAMSKTISYAQWSLEPYCIGMKLRSLRTQKRLTLSRLAGETGLSTALLSKLETERMIPTLPTLATISRVYGVGMSHFFTEPERHALSITRNAQMRIHGRGPEPERVIPLHLMTGSPCLHAQVVDLAPEGGEPLVEGEGRQVCGLIYVIEGRLELNAGGLPETLEAGDCLYIDTVMPLAWSAGGKARCRLLCVRPQPPRPPAA